MAAKWWCTASLLLCLAVAAASARDVPRDDCDTATFVVPAATAAGENNDVGVDSARAVDEAMTAADAFVGRTGDGGGLFGGVHGPLGGGVARFGPFGGAVAGAGPFGRFGGGGGLGGGGGGGVP